MATKAFSLKDDDRVWEKLKTDLGRLAEGETCIKVGVVGEAAAEQHKDGITNAELAAIHEFGAPKAHVPERSFIRSTFDNKRVEYERALQELTCRLFRGELNGAELLVALDGLGSRIAEDIRKRIESAAIRPADEAATEEHKERRGGDQRALVDTGDLLRSIGHAVVVSGQEEQ
jgi:hypothetical protein